MSNRTIKFRAWDGEQYLDWSGLKCPSMSVPELFNGTYTLEQFTGLYDKNGVEIYEGDIVESQWIGRGVVKFGGHSTDGDDEYTCGAYGWYVEVNPAIELEYLLDSDCMITGNIHESPELLNAE